MGNGNSTSSLFDSPDQERAVADLTTFFGPRGEKFLRLYERMGKWSPRKRGLVRSWNWAVFFLNFIWFFYRRQYIIGILFISVPLILFTLFGFKLSSFIVISFIYAGYANTTYVQQGIKWIAQADKLMLEGDAREDYLRRHGGTSIMAGIFGGFIYLCIALFLLIMKAAEHEALLRGG